MDTVRSLAALRVHRNKLGYRGVEYVGKQDKYRATLRTKHVRLWRGPRRKSVIEAAHDYDMKAREVYGAAAHLNFPREGELQAMRHAPDPGRCRFGHDLAYYGYVVPDGRVNCRQCNAWAQKRRKERMVALQATPGMRN